MHDLLPTQGEVMLFLAGLQLAVAIAHPLRATLSKVTGGRLYVMWGAVALYTVAALLCAAGLTIGLILSVVGPVVGLTVVVALGRKVDHFQIVLGIAQGIGAIVAITALIWRMAF